MMPQNNHAEASLFYNLFDAIVHGLTATKNQGWSYGKGQVLGFELGELR